MAAPQNATAMKLLKSTLRLAELVIVATAIIFLFLMLCTPMGNKIG